MPVESLDTYSTGGADHDLATVRDRILDLVDALVDDDLEVARRQQRERERRGFSPHASGATPGGGGPTNLMHDFATGKDGAGEHAELIPQHTDPVGELAVRELTDPSVDDLASARRSAYRHACNAARELEAGLSALAQTKPPAKAIDPQDRSVCWSCRRRGVVNELVYRDSDAGGRGLVEPRCRACYDWALAHDGIDPPELVVHTWADGRRLTTKIVDEAYRLEAARLERRSRNRSKKHRR